MQPGVRSQKSASLLHCTLKLFKCKEIQAMCLSANCWSLVNVTLIWSFLQRCNIRWWVIEREWNSWNKETIDWSLVLSAFCGFRKQNTQTFILDLKCVHDRDIRILILGTNAKWDEKWRENTSGPFCKLNKHIQFPDKQQVPAHQYHHHQYFAN